MNQAQQISLTPRMTAQRYYRDGEGLDANPYPKGSKAYEDYQWEMAKLQSAEFGRLLEEIRSGI